MEMTQWSQRNSDVYAAAFDIETAYRVLSAADVGVWCYIGGSQRPLASPAACRILGFDESAPFPTWEECLEVVHSADRQQVENETERIRSMPGSFAITIRVRAGRRDDRWVEIHGRSQHEASRFAQAGGIVCAAGERRDFEALQHVLIGAALPSAKRPVNLGMIVANVIDEMNTACPLRKIHLMLGRQLDGEWDPERLGLAIGNLVAMALEGSDPESLLTVRLTGRTNDVQITIRSSRSASGGSALALFAGGLMVAEEVIREHAGELHRSSTVGAGTQFRVVLPRRKRWASR
jgi:hypothetical protein